MKETGREQEKIREYYAMMLEAAKKAGKFLLDQRSNVEVIGGDSADGTLQTGADLASEDIIVEEIGSHYPGGDISNGASLIAEERGYKRAKGEETSMWIIDPLDGTSNYSAGRENWGVMVAYSEANQLQMGTISFPTMDVSVSSLRGQGVSINGEKVMRPEGKKMEESVVAFDSYGVQMRKEAVYDRKNYENLVGDVQESNCSAEAFLKLLRGEIQAFLEYKSTPWDDAAGAMLVRELGGIVTDFEGKEWVPDLIPSDEGFVDGGEGNKYGPKSKNLIATFDREIHRKLVEMLRKKTTQHKGKNKGEGLPNSFEGVLNNRQGSVEADAVILADGSVAIIHGKDFGKALEEIESLDVEQLQNLDIPNRAGEKSGQKSPLLREFAGLASDAGTAISLELKAGSSEKVLLLAEKIAAQLIAMKKEGGFKGNEDYLEKGMTFESFSVKALKILKEKGRTASLNFKATLYWPTDRSWAEKNPLFELKVLEDVGIEGLTWAELGVEVAFNNDLDGIEFQPGEITPQLVEYAHARGVEINSSLVSDPKQIDYLFSIGVDHVLIE